MTADEWERLRAADRLDAYDPDRGVTADQRWVELETALPMPEVSLLELTPSDSRD